MRVMSAGTRIACTAKSEWVLANRGSNDACAGPCHSASGRHACESDRTCEAASEPMLPVWQALVGEVRTARICCFRGSQ